MPLQLYLDSSDYSDFSNPKLAAKQPLLNRLITNVESGEIEIRFSAIILAEIYHVDDASKSFAVQRARLLKSLSQGRAIANCFDLFELEVKIYNATGKTLERNDAYRENYDIFDVSLDEKWAHDFRKQAISNIHEMIAKAPVSRAERRKMESTLIKGGFIRETAGAYLQSHVSSSLSDSDNPLDVIINTVSDKEWLYGFFTGKVPWDEFVRSFLNRFMNPEILVEHLIDSQPGYREKLYDALRGNTKNLALRLQGTLETVWESKRSYLAAGAGTEKASNRMIEKALQPSAASLRRTLISNQLGEAKQLRELADTPLGTFPSLDLFIWLAMELVRAKSVSAGFSPLMPSDLVDILHASYAPYFDLIRVDKRTEQLLKCMPEELKVGLAKIVIRNDDLSQVLSL